MVTCVQKTSASHHLEKKTIANALAKKCDHSASLDSGKTEMRMNQVLRTWHFIHQYESKTHDLENMTRLSQHAAVLTDILLQQQLIKIIGRDDQTNDQDDQEGSRSDSLTASKVLATASSAALAWKVVVIFTLLILILERGKANKLLTLRLTTAVVLVAAVALTLALVSRLRGVSGNQ